MPQLLTDCEAFIQNENPIDSGNFAEMWTVADQMEKPRIAEKVEQFILDQFAEIGQSTEFRSLPMAYLKKILASPLLKVNRESEVLDIIVQWIRDQPEKRSELVQLMVDVVRFDQLDSNKLLAMNRELVFPEVESSCFYRVEAAIGRRLSPEGSSLEMTDQERRTMQPRDSAAGLLMLAGTLCLFI